MEISHRHLFEAFVKAILLVAGTPLGLERQGLFAGRVKPRESPRFGSGPVTVTGPDPGELVNLLTRPDPTQPNPTRDIS